MSKLRYEYIYIHAALMEPNGLIFKALFIIVERLCVCVFPPLLGNQMSLACPSMGRASSYSCTEFDHAYKVHEWLSLLQMG